jgi:hygromycin-B 4-O-kinase
MTSEPSGGPSSAELTTEALLRFLSRKLGASPAWAPVSEGMESRVLAYTWDQEEFILRVHPKSFGFHKDRFCYQHFAAPGLPIPEIVEVGTFDTAHAYSLSRKLPGVTLQDSPASVLRQLAPRVSGIRKRIASSPLPVQEGFGRFDAQGCAEYASWKAFLQSTVHSKERDWERLFSQKILDFQTLQPVLQHFLELTGECPEVRELVHGDFGSNNVLTEGERITGVLDWDCALYGDSLLDVAGSFFWSPWLECMQIQAEHFERELQNEPQFSLRLQCYQLWCGLEELYENAQADNPVLLTWLVNRTLEVHEAGPPVSPSLRGFHGRSGPVYEQVYQQVRQIPRGRVSTYGRIAQAVPGCTARMVGYALSGLPESSDVPWQRVLNAQGKISPRNGGHGGLHQQQLLEAEGVRFDANHRVRWSEFGWEGEICTEQAP